MKPPSSLLRTQTPPSRGSGATRPTSPSSRKRARPPGSAPQYPRPTPSAPPPSPSRAHPLRQRPQEQRPVPRRHQPRIEHHHPPPILRRPDQPPKALLKPNDRPRQRILHERVPSALTDHL